MPPPNPSSPERRARGPSHFRQRDLEAALKAAEAAGRCVERVEIGSDGKIIIIMSRDGQAAVAANEWDEVL